MEFKHKLAQNKEQFEGYTVFDIDVDGSDKPIQMMCLTDVKQIAKVIDVLEGHPDNLKKLKEIERQLTLIRNDFSGYCNFTERNIRQSKEIKEWEESFEGLIETIKSLDVRTDTDKEREGLKLQIVNIIKGVKPNSSQE